MIADPKVSHRIGALASMPMHGLQARPPTFLWAVLGHSIPVPVQDEMTGNDRANWAAYVKIVAFVKCSGLQPNGQLLSIGPALQKGGFSQMRLHHLLTPPSRSDFRETLVMTASQMSDMGAAFSMDEMAELLLLESPDREEMLKKLRRDLNT